MPYNRLGIELPNCEDKLHSSIEDMDLTVSKLGVELNIINIVGDLSLEYIYELI